MDEDNNNNSPEINNINSNEVEQNIAPKLPKEEDALKEASANLEEGMEENKPAHQPIVGMQPKKSHKKLILAFLIILILAGLGFAIWKFVLNKKDTAKVETNSTKVEEIKKVNNSYEPENIAYAFKAAESDPFALFYRPATGGERTEIQKLDKSNVIIDQHSVGSIVIFITDNKLFLSNDSGKTYTKIYEKTGTEELISARVSNDQQRVAVSIIPEYGTKNNTIVYSLDLKGQDKKEIANSDKAILLLGFNSEKNKVAYSEGCYQCDGPRTSYKITDTTTKKATDIVKDLNVKTFNYSVAVSDDLTKFVYSEGLESTANGEGIGYETLPPYKINLVELDSLKVSTLDTVGTKGEKNTNGTDKIRDFSVGFLAGTNTPYYVDDKVITKIENSKPSQLYQSDKKILKVHFANAKNVIVSTGESTADYLLSNYSIVDSKSTQILSGDNYTVILGVTTK